MIKGFCSLIIKIHKLLIGGMCVFLAACSSPIKNDVNYTEIIGEDKIKNALAKRREIGDKRSPVRVREEVISNLEISFSGLRNAIKVLFEGKRNAISGNYKYLTDFEAESYFFDAYRPLNDFSIFEPVDDEFQSSSRSKLLIFESKQTGLFENIEIQDGYIVVKDSNLEQNLGGVYRASANAQVSDLDVLHDVSRFEDGCARDLGIPGVVVVQGEPHVVVEVSED